METNDLRELIGRQCSVIDPRGKRDEFHAATIIGANVNLSIIQRDGSITEYVSYTVELHKLTISKDRWGTTEYHRTFVVSGDRIRIY